MFRRPHTPKLDNETYAERRFENHGDGVLTSEFYKSVEAEYRDTAVIRRSVRMLDRYFGRGWVLLIDVDEFDLNSGHACVLGHLYSHRSGWEGGFHYGVVAMFTTLNSYVEEFAYNAHAWALAHGFVAAGPQGNEDDVDETSEDWHRTWDATNNRWVEVITERQATYERFPYRLFRDHAERKARARIMATDEAFEAGELSKSTVF